MQHPILVLAVSLWLVSLGVDSVDTVSNDNKQSESEETLGDNWGPEYKKMYEEHRWNNPEKIFVIAMTFSISQIALVRWRKGNPDSYHIYTLTGMWLVPLFLALKNFEFLFIVIWIVFSVTTSIVKGKAIEQPIPGPILRQVYKWFLLMYWVCNFFEMLGYIVMASTAIWCFLIVGIEINAWLYTGLTMVFYALYYGILSRDVAEMPTGTKIPYYGYYEPGRMPRLKLDPSVCALCGTKFLAGNCCRKEGVPEKMCRLPCSHVYHEFCIRGWRVIGTKQTCPYCHKIVDLKTTLPAPWDKPHILYHWVRWLVCWFPVILKLGEFINWILGVL